MHYSRSPRDRPLAEKAIHKRYTLLERLAYRHVRYRAV
ncbi:hypothetical protein VCHC51A1_2939, partial [Vibrio cholerae HC-51A1]